MQTTKKAKLREKNLKKTPFDKMRPEDIWFLERQGIINGVWPEAYWKVAKER